MFFSFFFYFRYYFYFFFCFFFFFSSRRRHTRLTCDWEFRRVLFRSTRVKHWGYRILLRPVISGVDPRWPKIVEIEQTYVVGKRKRDEIPWSMLVGLITHELGQDRKSVV